MRDARKTEMLDTVILTAFALMIH